METNRIHQQEYRLSIKASKASVELLEFSLKHCKSDHARLNLQKQIAIVKRRISVSTMKLNALIESDTAYQLFIVEYKALTEKIRIFESILSNENTFENSKNVKKLVKRRKQLKNAYLKATDITVSDLNEMIENSLKKA